ISFDRTRALAEQLARQTDEIQIIPARRGSFAAPSSLRQRLDAYQDPPQTADTSATVPPPAAASAAITDNKAEPAAAPGSMPPVRAVDLRTLLTSAEFREMHAPAVLEGLHGLTSCDVTTRSAAAGRIGRCGKEARTALPMLRAQLQTETESE